MLVITHTFRLKPPVLGATAYEGNVLTLSVQLQRESTAHAASEIKDT
jgi:hypothetical protein